MDLIFLACIRFITHSLIICSAVMTFGCLRFLLFYIFFYIYMSRSSCNILLSRFIMVCRSLGVLNQFLLSVRFPPVFPCFLPAPSVPHFIWLDDVVPYSFWTPEYVFYILVFHHFFVVLCVTLKSVPCCVSFVTAL